MTTHTAKTKTCFVICPIGAEGSDERKRSDMVLKHVFAKAVEPLGYKAIRADKISEPGMISQQILKQLMTADLAIADMTGYNANVFYELAVRHAVEKPVIHVIEAGQRIPFDVADLRTIEMKLDLDGAEQAVASIQEQVEAIEAGRSGDTPIKLAAAVQKLGNDPTNEVLREIVNSVSTLRADVDKVVRALHSPPPPQLMFSSGLSGIAGPVANPQAWAYPMLTLADLGKPTGNFRISDPPKPPGETGVRLPRTQAAGIGEVKAPKEKKPDPKS